jgi:hypothetical protein
MALNILLMVLVYTLGTVSAYSFYKSREKQRPEQYTDSISSDSTISEIFITARSESSRPSVAIVRGSQIMEEIEI